MLIAMGSVAASAADWIYYGRSKGGTISYYDRESVQYFVSDSEEYVTVWTKAIEPEGGSFIVASNLLAMLTCFACFQPFTTPQTGSKIPVAKAREHGS